MNNTITDNVKEIAEQLDCGFRAFYHNTTKQLLFVPNEMDFPSIELDSWEEELEALENNLADYTEIVKWTSSDTFEMMVEFAEQITNPPLQTKLLNALKRNKPFRAFKLEINNAGDYRQHWFDFKNHRQQQFLLRQFAKTGITDEE